MTRRARVALGSLCVGLCALGSQATPADSAAREARPVLLTPPVVAGSREPSLASLPDGRVVMSWTEPRPAGGMALRSAVLTGRNWSPPVTIAEGDSFFVNWADFPSVRSLGGDRLAAHWLWKSGAGTYAYDVRIAQSDDAGRSWGPAVTPHRDGTATEHGFVSLVPDARGVRAVWLDGRNSAGHDEKSGGPTADMTLRSAVLTPAGGIEDEAEIDGRTCDCCQTSATITSRGTLVAWRDRSADEVRDIQLARLEDGRWSAPATLHADDWHIAGCPVNGPALDARGARVAIAWYTGAADSPQVQVAFSDDDGTTFGAPIRVDDGSPLGRVHVLLSPEGSAFVVWLEQSGKEALLRARRVRPSGRAEPAATLVRTSAARASGFPRMAWSGERIVLAWTEVGSASRVRVALLPR